MSFKSKTSGLVLATVFSLGMVSSSLASAQNGRSTATFVSVNDENSGVSSEKNTAQEDFVTGKEVNDVPAVTEIPDAEGLGKTYKDSATNCETNSKCVFTDKLSPKSGDAAIGKGTLISSIGATAAVTSAVTGGVSSKIASLKNNNDKVSGANEELEKLKEQNSNLNDEISGLREETKGKIKKLEEKIPAGGVKGFFKELVSSIAVLFVLTFIGGVLTFLFIKLIKPKLMPKVADTSSDIAQKVNNLSMYNYAHNKDKQHNNKYNSIIEYH